jgi:pilus assembly protein Flp/PilA
MLEQLRTFVSGDEGQDLTEYALLLALIAIVCVAAVEALGTTIKGVFENTNKELAK